MLKSKYIKLTAVAAVVLLLSSGVSAVFTDSVSTQTQDLNTGTGSLEITGGNLQAKATSSVEDLVPGDSVTRDLFLTNAASYDLATISLEVTDSESGQPLTSNPEGLQLTVERETGPGSWSVIYGPSLPTGLLMEDIQGPAKTSLGVDHLRFTQTFIGPNTDKSLKDKVAQLTYIFTGTQRQCQNCIVPNLVSTIAGTGSASPPASGDGGPATSANIASPRTIAMDAGGNIYFSSGADFIRKISPSGTITRFAGSTFGTSAGDGGPATSARMAVPWGVTVHNNALYIADSENGRIRKVDLSTNIITTVVGTTPGNSGDGGPAIDAQLSAAVKDVVFDSQGNMYILDRNNNKIRKVTPAGIISTVVGTGAASYSGDGGPATSATINYPESMTIDANDNLYIGDNRRVRKVDLSTNIITTFAGLGTNDVTGDNGPANQAGTGFIMSLSHANDKLYISAAHRVRAVDLTTNIITTIAGTGNAGFSNDGGVATSAEFTSPRQVAVDSLGNIIILDQSNNRIRKITI